MWNITFKKVLNYKMIDIVVNLQWWANYDDSCTPRGKRLAVSRGINWYQRITIHFTQKECTLRLHRNPSVKNRQMLLMKLMGMLLTCSNMLLQVGQVRLKMSEIILPPSTATHMDLQVTSHTFLWGWDLFKVSRL